MKRQRQKKYEHGIYRTFSMFGWVVCEQCEVEFCRESGWRALTGPFFNGQGHWKYVCGKCVPTRKEAHRFFCNYVMPPRKRPIIAPPPQRIK